MKTILLIHGSWHGAWCWYKVAPLLQEKSYKVLVPDLPGHGKEWRWFRGTVTLGQMEKAMTQIIDKENQKVVVVAHSRYGILASRLAELRPEKIEKVVYLAAYMVRSEERAYDFFRSDKDSLLNQAVQINRTKITDMIPREVYKDALYADCEDQDVQLAYSLLTPEPSLPALTRLNLTERNYGRVEKYYIELTEDKAVSISMQRQLISRSPVKKVYSIKASHSAYFSKPGELAAIIHEISQGNSKPMINMKTT